MPITRIREAKPVELEAPTTGSGDTVAIHARKSDNSHEPLTTDDDGALRVAVVSGGGGGGSEPLNRELWSTGFSQNLAQGSYIPGTTVIPADYPYYPNHTKWKIVCAAGIATEIRLYGRLADGTEVTHQAGFSGGECIC